MRGVWSALRIARHCGFGLVRCPARGDAKCGWTPQETALVSPFWWESCFQIQALSGGPALTGSVRISDDIALCQEVLK